LETLRAYARARLDERGEADQARRSHARYYAQRAEQRSQTMDTVIGVEAEPTMASMALDTDDVRAAISWSLDSPRPDDAELALRIVAPFAVANPNFRLAAGVVASATRLLERTEGSSPTLRARLLVGLASDAPFIDGDIARASALAGQAMVILADLPTNETATSPMASMSRTILGMAALARGDLYDARQILAQRRRLANHDHQLSMVEMMAYWLETAAGDAGAAQAHVQAALTLARRSQFLLRIAQALDLLARATLRSDPPIARAAHAEMVELVRAHPYLEVAGQHISALLTSAELTLAEHRPGEALSTLRQAAVHVRGPGLPVVIRAALVLAHALSDLDRSDPAATLVGFATQSGYNWSLIFHDPAELQLRQSRLRTHMGDDAYNTAITEGAALSLDEIGAFMVTAIDDVIGPSN
jgi:hypothetical protein